MEPLKANWKLSEECALLGRKPGGHLVIAQGARKYVPVLLLCQVLVGDEGAQPPTHTHGLARYNKGWYLQSMTVWPALSLALSMDDLI